MSLQNEVMAKLKEAMKAKDKIALETLRAVKSALLLEQTSGTGEELSKDAEVALVQKLVKQRKDSASLYTEQGREDLAEPELEQAKVLMQFLPKQLTQEEIVEQVTFIKEQVGATSMKDMGKLMGMASKQLAGKADGKTISAIVKQLLA